MDEDLPAKGVIYRIGLVALALFERGYARKWGFSILRTQKYILAWCRIKQYSFTEVSGSRRAARYCLAQIEGKGTRAVSSVMKCLVGPAYWLCAI